MKICHVCKAECEDDLELCPVCGAVLKTQAEPEPEDEIILINPVLAASVEDVVTAEIFRDILIEHKIFFTCDDGDSGGSMKVLFGGGFVAQDIYVDEKDFEQASLLYEEVLNSEADFEFDFDEELI